MTLQNYKVSNNGASTLEAGISAGSWTLILATGTRDLFPSTFPFFLTLEQYNASLQVTKREIVKVTAGATEALTIVRSAGYCPDDYAATTLTNTAFSFDAGDSVKLKLVGEIIDDINAELARLLATEIPAKVSKAGDNMTGLFKEAQGADIASATTTDLSAATGNSVKITGTTTITGFGTVQAGTTMKLTFTGILTLTYNATSLILPNAGANITTAAGDSWLFVSLGSGNWKCISYNKADGTALAVASTGAGWTTISTWTLGAANATLMDVTSISSTYDAFRITIGWLNVAGSSRDIWLRFNNDSGSNYATESTFFSSGTVTAVRESSQTKIRLNLGQTVETSSTNLFTITVSKPTTGMPACVNFDGKINNTTSVTKMFGSADWNNTSAKIDRIKIQDEDGTGVFDTGSFYILEWYVVA